MRHEPGASRRHRASFVVLLAGTALLADPGRGEARAPSACSTMAAPAVYAAGPDPEAFDAGDLNGDGVVDLVVSSDSWSDLAILLGNGDGTFPAPAMVPAGVWAGDPVVADLSGDGIPDVAVPSGANRVSILLGLGGGGFSAPVLYPLPVSMTGNGHLAVADVDGDGDQDLAVTGSLGVAILKGNGNGTFGPGVAYPTGCSGEIAASDLDLDGDVDLAIMDRQLTSYFSILLGNGDGSFQPYVLYQGVEPVQEAILVGRIDGDAAPDLVIACRGVNASAYVYLNDGAGGFAAGVAVAAGTEPWDAALGDLNGDGATDLVLASAAVVLGNGDGTFQPPVDYAAGGLAVALADLDGNATLDLASIVGQAGIAIVPGNGDGTLRTAPSYDVSGPAYAVAAGDFDGDGDEDLAAATETGVDLLPGRGDGTFQAAVPVPVPAGRVDGIASDDADGDGVLDLVVSCTGANLLLVMLGNGDGTFRPAASGISLQEPGAIALEDFDGDGQLDAAVSTWPNTVVTLRGAGDGTFGQATSYVVGRLSWLPDLDTGDFDGNGTVDLVVADFMGTTTVLFGDGKGRFAGASYVPLPVAGVWSNGIADLDADGDQDIVVGTTAGIGVALNSGNGTFPTVAFHPAVGHVSVADVDSDLVPDVIATSGSITSLLVGSGSGTLEAPRSFLTSYGAWSAAVSDLDADGDRDLALADARGTIQVVLGTAPGMAPSSLPDAVLSQPYAQTLTASGVTPPYTFALAGGVLPPGMALSSGGSLSGTPTATGYYAFTVTLADAAGCGTSRAYSLVVVPSGCGVLSLAPDVLPRGYVLLPYGVALSASGGAAPYSFAVVAGTLPAGLSLSPSGIVSGVPVSMERRDVTIATTDASGCLDAHTRTLTIVTRFQTTVDYLLGQGAGQGNPNRVRIYDGAGNPTATDFLAYGAGSWGTRVDAGDPAGLGLEQILTGPGPGPIYGPQVRGFRRAGTPIAKINFYAYGTLRYGVNPTAAELDLDGYEEIVTGAGPGAVFGPHVRGFDYDAVRIQPVPGCSFYAYGTTSYGVNVGAGRLDGAGPAQILTGTGPGPGFAGVVRGWRYGASVAPMARINFVPYTQRHGVVVAGGDVEADGFAEILTAPGPGPTNPLALLGFDYDATIVSPAPGLAVTPSPTLYGGRVGAGDAMRDFAEDLMGAPGPDPAGAALVWAYRYASGSLVPLAGTPFTPFPGAYGVNVAGAMTGL